MEGAEELRETLVAMRREIDILRVEATHATLLLEALDAMLGVEGDDDPFIGVFSALLPVFRCSHAIVLIEKTRGSEGLECIASSYASVLGSVWSRGRKMDKALSGRILTTISAVEDDGWPDIAELSQSQPTLYLPLGVRDRRGLMLLLRDHDQPGFDRTHVTLARKFSVLASHAFATKHASQTEAESHRLQHLTRQLKASQEALTFRANHDQLTGLPNRVHVQELVDAIIARKQPDQKVALAFLDLDDFKRVNDFHGHAAGDTLLKSVSDRLRAEIRQSDIIGRISGDEFVIVFDPFERTEEISVVVNRVSDQLREPFRVEGQEITTSGSIGVALWPVHGHDYDTLRRHADTAMYRAKAVRKGGVTFFSPAMGHEVSKRLSLEHQLHVALANREFQCALQQKVNLRTHEIVGFEALVRWVDSHGNIHSPATFLPLATELGMLDNIAGIVLDHLGDTLPWLDGRFGAATRYSVNISPSQATNTSFMQTLVRRIVDTGRPERFLLELTEETFVATDVFLCQGLPLIREAGIGVSIDDFGTGYSSLAILADITADELKVDRSLITSIHRRPRNQSILRAIESLGTNLGMTVMAEGIETVEEKAYLLDSTRLTIGQGYLFHKPQLISQMIAEQSSSNPVPGVNA
ncbi:MAG: putative bifunctional diguanylate cyclase/phosphodiesterase [Marinobacter sp.]